MHPPIEPMPATLFGEATRFDEAAAQQMLRFIEDFGHVYRERNKALDDLTPPQNEAFLHLFITHQPRDEHTTVNNHSLTKLNYNI
ncbi:MAG: hypothetical protein ACK59X_03595, partial [Acidovorax sp.]